MCHDISRSRAVTGRTKDVELTLYQAISCVFQQYITGGWVRLIQPEVGQKLHAKTAGY